MATDPAVVIHHLTDDLEKIRTHPIRTIQNVDPLLSLAVDALDNGDLEVVREFLDRTRDALAGELRWLRAATYGNSGCPCGEADLGAEGHEQHVY